MRPARSSSFRPYRLLRASARRRNYATQVDAAVPPVKRRRFRTFLLTSVLLLASGYGAGAYFSTKNDRVKDTFLNLAPGASLLVDYLEEASLKELGAAKGQPSSKKAEESLKSARERAAKAAEAARLRREQAAQEAAQRAQRLKEEAEAKAKDEAAALKAKAEAAAAVVADEVQHIKAKAAQTKQEFTAQAPEAAKALADKAQEAVKGVLPAAAESAAVNASSLPAPVDVEVAPAPLIAPAPAPALSSSKKEWTEPVPLGFEVPADYTYTPPPQRKLLSAQEKLALLPPPLPLVAPSVSQLSSEEPILGQLASTIDSLAAFLKDNPTNAHRSDSVKEVLSVAEMDLKALGDRLHSIRGEEHKKLEESLESQSKEYQAQLVAREQDLLDRLSAQEDDWRTNFELEREKVRQDFRTRLEEELAVQKELINERLKEELVVQGIEMQRKWLRDIKVRVEEERGGRLAKLEQLSTDVQKLQQAAFASDAYLDEALKINRLWTAIQAAQGSEGRSLASELLAVKELASLETAPDDSTISLALATVAPETAEKGITPFTTLSEWFVSRLAPRIKQAALMPDRGGCLAYFASSAISPFLFEKAGYVPGNDVMAVLSRTHYFLGKRDLEGATREINQLRGWPKILARDWLEAARRHLEVKQALSVAETEAKLRGLLVI